jgi:acyl phosphate:glycerol-3-phosphate acyltransferase
MDSPGLNLSCTLTSLLIVVVSYFIGAFPHLVLLCKLGHIETTGDLHINLWQKAGPLWGLSGIIIDILKGTISVWLSKSLGFDLTTVVACGLAAAAGQMWPVFHKFNGEKGNTTGLGMALALVIQPLLIALIPVMFGLISKLVRALGMKGRSLGSRLKTGSGQSNALPIGVILGFIILPIAAFWYGASTQIIVGFIVLLAMVIIRRLTAGLTEDLKTSNKIWKILWNRLIYDRSYF